jgi:hypothetical protein
MEALLLWQFPGGAARRGLARYSPPSRGEYLTYLTGARRSHVLPE